MIEYDFTSEASDVTLRVEVDDDGETTIVTRFAVGGNTVALECEMPAEDLVAWFRAMEPAVRKYEDELAVDEAEKVLSDYHTEQRLARQVFCIVTRRGGNNLVSGYTLHTKECRLAADAYTTSRVDVEGAMATMATRSIHGGVKRTLCLICNPAGEATRRLKRQLGTFEQGEVPEILREGLKAALIEHETIALKARSS